MIKLSSIAVILIVISTSGLAEEDYESTQFNTDLFESLVPRKNHFIMFYAPWCDHCKRLSPVWNELFKKFKLKDTDIAIAKVDCTMETSLCSKHDVTGYPTLKFFKVGEEEGLKFRGSRDLSSLSTFVYEQSGKKEQNKDDPDVADDTKTDEVLIELTEDTFHEHVKKGKHFVKFYAPWCGHCQKLAPTWEELAKTVNKGDQATICKVDCTIQRSVCNEFEVKGYPTMLWIENGKKTEKYQGSRSLTDLQDFVSKMSDNDQGDADKEGEEEGAASNPVLVLTGPTFEHQVSTGFSFIKFFAPWCGHCKRLAPTWDELALKLAEQPNVKVAKVDCTLSENKELCNTQEVDGFPTIFLYQDGTKISEYNGSRSLEDLYQFVAKYLSEQKPKDEL